MNKLINSILFYLKDFFSNKEIKEEDIEKPINHGFIPVEPTPEDFTLGSMAGKLIETKDGHGLGKYIPESESQNKWFERWWCVSESALNNLESKIKFYIANNYKLEVISKLKEMGYIKNGEVNFSARFSAIRNGTVPGRGNNQKTVADHMRHDGLVPEWDLPDGDFNNAVCYDPQRIPLEVERKARKFAEIFDITYWWVEPNVDTFIEAYKNGLVQTSGFSWLSPVNGIYQRSENTANHCFNIFEFQQSVWNEAFDQYDIDFKKLAWNFKLGWGMQFDIDLKRKFNVELIKKLLADGYKAIQRTDAKGEVYKLDIDYGLIFLDSNKDNKHIPLVDWVLSEMYEDKKVMPVSEADYKRINGK